MSAPRFDFTGKVALVTGGSSGIGRAAALAFAQAGGAVAIGDIDASGQAVADEINDMGGRAVFFRTDVLKAEDCRGLVAAAVDTWGQLDFAFNNAGIITAHAAMGDLDPRAWDAALAINLTGVFTCMQAEIAVMQKRGGAIVNNASIMGMRGAPGVAAYSASKHGVIGLTRTAAMDYGRAGIRINVVCPGFVRTAMTQAADAMAQKAVDHAVRKTALRRLGEPDEIVAAVLWLCSDGASFVTGAVIAADGGFTAN